MISALDQAALSAHLYQAVVRQARTGYAFFIVIQHSFGREAEKENRLNGRPMGNTRRDCSLETMAGADPKVVTVSFRDLQLGGADTLALLKQAFGSSGLGILLVSGVPFLAEHRQQLLPLSQRFVVS